MDLLSESGFVPPTELPTYRRVLLFGRPGVGKTSGMLTADKSIMIGTERGIASLAKAGTTHRGTGEMLHTFKPAMFAKEFDGVRELHNTLLKWYKAGAFRDPESLLQGARCLCIDGIDTIRKYVNEEYDAETGRSKEMQEKGNIFNTKEIGMTEMGKRAEPFNKILKIIEHANMHLMMTCKAKHFDFINVTRKKKKQQPLPDEPSVSEKAQYMCDMIIEMLEPSRSEIPRDAKDRHGWFKVYDKSRYGGNWRANMVQQHFDFDRMCEELDELERLGMARSKDPLDPPTASRTMKTVDNDVNLAERVEMCLSNVLILEMADKLGIPIEVLRKGAVKYGGDVETVTKMLEDKLKKKEEDIPPPEDYDGPPPEEE